MSALAELATPVAVGDLSTVALQGDVPPGRLGGWYFRIGSASINDSGVVVFAADLAWSVAAAAIVRVVRGRSEVLIRAGELAPGGGRYAAFGELDLGDDDTLLFQARLSGTGPSHGLFLRTAHGTQAVAHAGPGCDYASFESLTLISYALPSGPHFRLAYTARRSDGRICLVIWPSYRAPSTVLTTGDPLADGTLEGFTVSRLGSSLCLVAQVRRAAGIQRVAALASEDRVSWGQQLSEGALFPSLGRVSRLLGPPGMYAHQGFVAAELDDGRTVLAVRSASADPEVFAETGDPAPGVAGRRIARFGPPLANHGLPAGGPCGIASVITIDGGGSALWLGVFTCQRPVARAALMPLVTGDHTDDQPAARVDAFTPIKLSNTGTLLLRSTMDVSGKRLDGLLSLDGLFNWRGAGWPARIDRCQRKRRG